MTYDCTPEAAKAIKEGKFLDSQLQPPTAFSGFVSPSSRRADSYDTENVGQGVDDASNGEATKEDTERLLKVRKFVLSRSTAAPQRQDLVLLSKPEIKTVIVRMKGEADKEAQAHAEAQGMNTEKMPNPAAASRLSGPPTYQAPQLQQEQAPPAVASRPSSVPTVAAEQLHGKQLQPEPKPASGIGATEPDPATGLSLLQENEGAADEEMLKPQLAAPSPEDATQQYEPKEQLAQLQAQQTTQ
mmetsp:Transcript_24568/g.61832  ORF Transcript_24568/g.61832 Transcript_24568/m.61832 type:complete len:243 (-) Transcript_24568:170-898(-)